MKWGRTDRDVKEAEGRAQEGGQLRPRRGQDHLHYRLRVGEVPRGEKMLYSGTDPKSYITEYTLVYEE